MMKKRTGILDKMITPRLFTAETIANDVRFQFFMKL